MKRVVPMPRAREKSYVGNQHASMPGKGKPRITYRTLASAQVTDTKRLVISSCSKGGFTIAQQVVVHDPDDGNEVTMFMRGAIHVKDLNALAEVSEAIEDAIKKSTATINEDVESITWDDWDDDWSA